MLSFLSTGWGIGFSGDHNEDRKLAARSVCERRRNATDRSGGTIPLLLKGGWLYGSPSEMRASEVVVIGRIPASFMTDGKPQESCCEIRRSGAVPEISVVIPCYKVKAQILDVIAAIGSEASKIYVVDDACPVGSGQFVLDNCTDPRVRVLKHESNKGVGGAVMTGYRAAIADGAKVIVKIDGDGQMDPGLMMDFVEPILDGRADYTKGNRFYDPEQLSSMPLVRLLGNGVLSLMAKLSSGYWQSFDPTNGYTAIHANIANLLPFHKISERYFFETDILFRLNTFRAVVADVPMAAKYGNEVSNLHILKCIGEFTAKHARNFFKRVIYNYYLRDVSLASIELPVGILMFFGGLIYGLTKWYEYGSQNLTTPPGTVIVAVLPILLGVQFILTFLSYDIANYPQTPLHNTRSLGK